MQHNSYTAPGMVLLWSPHPFFSLSWYQEYVQHFLQYDTDLIIINCRHGNSMRIRRLLASADLILLFLDQEDCPMSDLHLYPQLYQRPCLPVLCNYRKLQSPSPALLHRYCRFYAPYFCLLPPPTVCSHHSQQVAETGSGSTRLLIDKKFLQVCKDLKESEAFLSYHDILSYSEHVLKLYVLSLRFSLYPQW